MAKPKPGRAAGNNDGATTEPLAVSVPEAARLIGIGRSSVYKAMADGGLPTLKIGKRRLVPTAALRRWIDGQQAA